MIEVRFSIVVPVYNSLAHLSQCLSSLRGQTYSDYEVILVDDGSTDGSAEVCDSFAASCSNVRVSHGENRGVHLARISGVGMARGGYIVFVDADDCLHEDALLKCSAEVDANDPDIIMFPFSRKEGYVGGENETGLEQALYADERYGEVKAAVCCGGMHHLWAKAIRRSLFDLGDVDPLRPRLAFAEDLFWLLPLVGRASSLSFLGDTLYYYRQNAGGLTSRYRREQLDDLVTALDRLFSYAELWGGRCPHDAALGALRQFCFLIKILIHSELPKDERIVELDAIGEALGRYRHWMLPAMGSARLDNRLLRQSVVSGRHATAVATVRLVDLLKKLRG